MDIYPQDLGRALEGEARRRRELLHQLPPGMVSIGGSVLPHRIGSALASVWQFAAMMAAINAIFGRWLWCAVCFGIAIFVWAAGNIWKAHFKSRVSRAHIPQKQDALTAKEIEWLRADSTDSLQGAYLDLTMTALASPAPPDGLSHTHLRDALRALGDAVRDVPELSFKLTPRDAKEMQTVAERLTHDAAQETDTVVADSLRRRADALHSQAETVNRAQSLLRRNAALRLELFDQMAALRTGLAASAIGHTGGARDLSALAASIASVAAEAAAVTGARAEVDSYLHVPEEPLPLQKGTRT